MKALRTILTAVVLLTGAMTMNAQRMSIVAMQNNARFLTDRMAYTLGISDPYLIDEIYRINYDYIWGVNDYLDDVALGYYYDDYMAVCAARDAALRNLLGYTIWNRLIGYNYFYRPIVFANRGWRFSIYDYDRYGIHHFYYHAPRPIARGYAGGHFFHGMAPRGGRNVGPAPHMNHGGTPAPRMNNGGTPAPHMNHSGTNAPRGGTPDVNRGNNHNYNGSYNRGNSNHNVNTNVNVNVNRNINTSTNVNQNMRVNQGGAPDMNRGGNTHNMRSGSNMNSSSRQTQMTSAPSYSNASMTTRGSGVSMSRGGGSGMGSRGGGAGMSHGGGRVSAGRR